MPDLLLKFDATVSKIRGDLEANLNQEDGYVLGGDADADSEDLTCAVIFLWGPSAKHFCGRFLRDRGVSDPES